MMALGPVTPNGLTLEREETTPAEEWWTGSQVGVLVGLGAKHSRSVDDVDYPVLDWEDSGPSHQIHLLGYEEPNDKRWVWVVEARKGPHLRALRFDEEITFTTRDQEDAFERIAAILNWLTYNGAISGPTRQHP